MCGIIGVWDHKNRVSSGSFKRCLDTLTHRGPDDYGVFEEEGLFLGMRRLSIIDIEGGKQPIYSPDKQQVLVFNGEIYNYLELKEVLMKKGHTFKTSSDSEVLMHQIMDGPGGISGLRGMFGFAHFNKHKQELLICRDRLGQKPLYYFNKPGDCFVFASELKGILAITKELGIKLQIDASSIYSYLSFLNVPQPKTIYQGVKSLEKANYLTVNKKGEDQSNSYWQLDYLPKTSTTLEASMDRMQEIIQESVKMRLRSDVPVGIFLSGGLDSSVVAYEASKLSDKLTTFTVAIEGDKEFDESGIARNTAQQLGLKNVVLPLKINVLETVQKVIGQYDQPYADPSAIPSLGISQLASEQVKVVLNGDGGDEQFAGYRRYVLTRYLDKLRLIPNPLKQAGQKIFGGADRRSYRGFVQRMLRIASLPPGEDRYVALTTDTFADEEKQGLWKFKEPGVSNIYEYLDNVALKGIDYQMHMDSCINLPSGLLVKMDIASSAYSLEARSPLLDHKLFEFSARLPDQYRVSKGLTKYILRKAYTPYLSEEVVLGKKKGFEIPLKRWLDDELLELKNDLLHNSSAKIYDYLDPVVIADVLTGKSFSDRNNAYIIYSLIILEAWLNGQQV